MTLDFFIQHFSYIGIFVLMTANGMVNFPSSQILYVLCGYFVGKGTLALTPTVIAGTLGNTLGNALTFLLVKKYEKPLARKLLMLDEVTFIKVHTALHETFSRKGMWWIFFGKLIPSVKAFIPVVAGLAETKTKLTITLFFIASFLWALLIISIGYFFGKQASLASLSGVSLAIGAVVFFILYSKISKQLEK